MSPVKKHYGSQDPWTNQCLEKIDQGDLGNGTDLFEASDHYFHKQFMESFSTTNYSKLDDDSAWSSQERNTETTTYDRSGRPDVNFLENCKKSSTLVTRKFFSTEPRNPSGTKRNTSVTDQGA